MKTLLVTMILSACTVSAPDPHAVVDCVNYTVDGKPYVGKCEAACETTPPTGGPLCSTAWTLAQTPGGQYQCQSFEWNGVVGCCATEPQAFTHYAVSTVAFSECQ